MCKDKSIDVLKLFFQLVIQYIIIYSIVQIFKLHNSNLRKYSKEMQINKYMY